MLDKRPLPVLDEGSSFVTMAASPDLSGCPFLAGGGCWPGMRGFLTKKLVHILGETERCQRCQETLTYRFIQAGWLPLHVLSIRPSVERRSRCSVLRRWLSHARPLVQGAGDILALDVLVRFWVIQVSNTSVILTIRCSRRHGFAALHSRRRHVGALCQWWGGTTFALRGYTILYTSVGVANAIGYRAFG